MPRLLEFLRSLGPSGATANARVLLEQRRREDRVVEAVARQFASVDGTIRAA
jgi:hypothetical protein